MNINGRGSVGSSTAISVDLGPGRAALGIYAHEHFFVLMACLRGSAFARHARSVQTEIMHKGNGTRTGIRGRECQCHSQLTVSFLLKQSFYAVTARGRRPSLI